SRSTDCRTGSRAGTVEQPTLKTRGRTLLESVGDDAPMTDPDPQEGAPAGVAVVVPSAGPQGGRRTNIRWVICALLFFATTINYVDRATLSMLAPGLKTTIGWTSTQFGDINAAFTLAYALGYLLFGRLTDRLG